MGGGGGGGMGGAMGCPGGGTNGWWSYRNLGLSDDELQGLAVFNSRANCSSSTRSSRVWPVTRCSPLCTYYPF